ncbi:hypothetical protein QVD17_18343 [Tagetes erecta]|uniref:PGG domain-containing protein n=1 Tax=Tagetes erecta TaxID=13708 RepID=A0AAD8NW70_TARER|nr:hypothetical protein QVD17_18343 [Tagetes erecta]
MSTKYPFPSHVSLQSFVTVKLNDKHMYILWKTQVLCLLKGHEMLGFINESSPLLQVDDEWNKRDAIVRAWILGSLSDHVAIALTNSLKSKGTRFTAKHVWDQVQKQEQESKGCCGIDIMKKVNEMKDKSSKRQLLYHAIECGKLEEVEKILNKKEVEITDNISINGNTALHIAVAYNFNSDRILKSMLKLLPNDIPLKVVRNVDGSTPLHLAASYGNTNAAKILIDKNRDLLFENDNEGCTPLDITLSEPKNKEMCLLLMKHHDHTTFDAYEHMLTAIAYKHFDLAMTFIQRCDSFNTRVVLMAIAQNCPADFTPNQLLVHELFQTPVFQFITRGASDMKGCMKFRHLVIKAGLAYPYKLIIRICMKLKIFKNLEERMKQRQHARDLLDFVCATIKFSRGGEGEAEADAGDFYSEAMLEAIRRDASDVVEIIVYWFPEAAMIVDEYGHNIAQVAWKNRAIKVYALILDGNLAKHTSLSSQKMKQDHCGNNFLHFAARLASAKKLDHTSSPPFRMQRELQWFKLAHEIIPQGGMDKNCFGETPEMVFTKEHKDLEVESGEWIKTAANAVAITATLIITIMFAATVQVPGGSDDKGLPHLVSRPAFMVFEVSITSSAMASALALLLFLVILTSPRTQEAYMLRLPLALVIGILSLFMSATLAIMAFASALYIIFGPLIIGLMAPIVVLPICFFFLGYFWFLSVVLTDFLHSIALFFIIRAFRHLKLVGQIFI